MIIKSLIYYQQLSKQSYLPLTIKNIFFFIISLMRQLSHDPCGVIGLKLLVLPALRAGLGAYGSAAAFSRREALGERVCRKSPSQSPDAPGFV